MYIHLCFKNICNTLLNNACHLLLNNVLDTDYDKFALDLSLPGKQETNDKTVKKAFLIKRGGEDTFTIKFNVINQFKKYVKVKAELETKDSSVTPSCDGYQIKLA